MTAPMSHLPSPTQRPSPSHKVSASWSPSVGARRSLAAFDPSPSLLPSPLQNIRAAKEISFSSPISRKEKTDEDERNFSHHNFSFLLSRRAHRHLARYREVPKCLKSLLWSDQGASQRTMLDQLVMQKSRKKCDFH